MTSRSSLLALLAVAALISDAATANAQFFFPRWSTAQTCPSGQCPTPKNDPPAKPGPEETTAEDKSEESEEPPAETLSVARTRFFAPSVEVADACDEILDRLEERYGKPKVWNAFPVYFRAYTGNGVAGYTQYGADKVVEVVVYESLSKSVGGTLDHELTHAFFFYLLQSNIDLFLNEGLAQNSEYRRRETLRQTVYRRYSNGEFWEIDRLYGRNRYDAGLVLYHEGFSVVDFLIARGGSLWIAAFMDELVKTNDVDRTLQRFYGYKNLKELQTAWREYVEDGQDRQSVRAIY